MLRRLLLFLTVFCGEPALAVEPVPIEQVAPPPSTAGPALAVPADDATKLPLGDGPPRSTETRPSLLPEAIPRVPPAPAGRKSPDVRNPGATFRPPASAPEMDLRVRYQKARSIAESDGKVRNAWDYSRVARTDHEKRQSLKRYYDLLFGKMLAIDRGIAPLVEERRQPKRDALQQLQVAPTVPQR